MLIHVNKNYFARGKTGKGKFCQRLVKAWREDGVEVTEDPDAKADVALHIGRMNYKSKARKNVLRVGPACIDTNMNWRKINKEKAVSVRKADAVVYQSKYSKKIYHKLVCNPDKPETIIHNGADPRDYKNVSYMRSTYQYKFLTSTRVWLKQKRLEQIVNAFVDASITDSCLFVCGDTLSFDKDKYKDCDINFLGKTKDDILSSLYCSCDVMIHLTYVDACPNSVVEAQVAGLPVICGDQGGTCELIKGAGLILSDKKFNFNPINLDKPPKINKNELVYAMRQVVDGDYIGDGNIDELYIQNIAKQYIKFFESIL